MRFANLALRFVLELCILAALGWWGVRTGGSPAAKIALGLAAPAAAGALWGMFVAPRAWRRARDPLRLALELVIFGTAALALWAVGRPMLAVSFALAVMLNEMLMQVWGQRTEA